MRTLSLQRAPICPFVITIEFSWSMLLLVNSLSFLWCFTEGQPGRQVLLGATPAANSSIQFLRYAYMYAIIVSPHLPIFFIFTCPRRSLKQVIKGNSLVAIGAFKCFTAHIFGEAHLGQVLDLVIHGDLTRIILGPLSSFSVEGLQVVLIHLSHNRILRIIYSKGKHARSAHIIVVRKEEYQGQLLTRLRCA